MEDKVGVAGADLLCKDVEVLLINIKAGQDMALLMARLSSASRPCRSKLDYPSPPSSLDYRHKMRHCENLCLRESLQAPSHSQTMVKTWEGRCHPPKQFISLRLLPSLLRSSVSKDALHQVL